MSKLGEYPYAHFAFEEEDLSNGSAVSDLTREETSRGDVVASSAQSTVAEVLEVYSEEKKERREPWNIDANRGEDYMKNELNTVYSRVWEIFSELNSPSKQVALVLCENLCRDIFLKVLNRDGVFLETNDGDLFSEVQRFYLKLTHLGSLLAKIDDYQLDRSLVDDLLYEFEMRLNCLKVTAKYFTDFDYIKDRIENFFMANNNGFPEHPFFILNSPYKLSNEEVWLLPPLQKAILITGMQLSYSGEFVFDYFMNAVMQNAHFPKDHTLSKVQLRYYCRRYLIESGCFSFDGEADATRILGTTKISLSTDFHWKK